MKRWQKCLLIGVLLWGEAQRGHGNIMDTSVIFFEDFSGPNPLANYVLENPPSPADGQSPMSIGIANEALTLDYLYGFGVAWVKHQSPIGFRDTFFESDLRLETSYLYDPRGWGNIGWVNGSSAQGYITFGLQLDEDRAYIFIWDSSTSDWTYAPIQVDRNVTYRLRLEVRSPNLIQGYVNDQLVVSMNFDLSRFPAQMNPGVGANSYP
jgi:hypothetical protein